MTWGKPSNQNGNKICIIILCNHVKHVRTYYIYIYAPRRFSHVNRKSITGDKSFTANTKTGNTHVLICIFPETPYQILSRALAWQKIKGIRILKLYIILIWITYLLIAADYCIYYCQTHRDRQNFLVEVKAMCLNCEEEEERNH